jgi:hypothetical protein
MPHYAGDSYAGKPVHLKKVKGGAGGIRTPNLSIMLTTSVFTAPLGFVVWTLPSSFYRCSPSSLYTFILRCLARYYHFKGFTDFEEFFFIAKEALFFKRL